MYENTKKLCQGKEFTQNFCKFIFYTNSYNSYNPAHDVFYNPYFQLAFYALYVLKEQTEENTFSVLISDFLKEYNQNYLSKFSPGILIESIDKFFEFYEGPYDLSLMHKIFTLFGIVPINSLKRINLKTLEKIFNSVSEDFNEKILELKKIEHYKEASKGLKTFILILKFKNREQYLILLEKTRDFNQLLKLLTYIIKNTRQTDASIDQNDIDLIFTLFGKISLIKKEKLIKELIEAIKNMNLLLKVLTHCDEDYMRKNKNIIKKNLFPQYGLYASPSEIVEIIPILKSFPILYKIFDENNFLFMEYISKSLNNSLFFLFDESIESYSSIFELLTESELFKRFRYGEVIQKVISKFGFFKTKKIILLLPDQITIYFED